MKKIFLSIFEAVKTVALVFIVAFVIRNFLIQTFVIDGASMEPNFHDSEYILIDKISYRFALPQRGEVIVFKPEPSSDSYIKRVIGLPGENVRFYNNDVYINNRKLEESYLDHNSLTRFNANKIFELNDNEYFVLGDNRGNSKDSRSFGPIDKNQIEGRVFVIFFPLDSFRLI